MRVLWLLCLVAACETNAAPPAGAPPIQPVSTPAAPVSTVSPVTRDAQVPSDADPGTLPGDQMYAALCAPCHGKDLRGYAADNAPSLVTRSFLESATDDFLKRSIITGRPATSMAAYGKRLGGPLDDAAVDRLVAYIREQGVPAKPTLPLVPKGNAAAGAPLYAKLCASCHGDTQNRREGIHLANIMFQAQATDPFIKYAIVHGREGTKMVPFEGALTDAQMNDIVAHIRTLGGGGKQAAPAQLPAPTGKEPLVINPKGKDPGWKPRDGRFVSVDDVHRAYAAGAKMIIVDARPPSDWMRAHIKGAVSIPYHDLKRLPEIPKNTWVVAYCACPHHLSGLVVDELAKRGHTKAVVLDEGINDWHRKGYPMTAAEGVQPPSNESHSGHDHSGHDHSGHGH